MLSSTAPAFAARGIVTTVVPVPIGYIPFSPISGPDGNIWFALSPYAGGVGYIVRLQPGGGTTLYPLPAFSNIFVQALPTMALDLIDAPRNWSSPNTRQLVFNWLAYDAATQNTNASGFGTIDVDNPTNIQEYGSQYPGDPLYDPRLVFESQAFKIAATSSPPAVWSYAHSGTGFVPPPELRGRELIARVPFPFSPTSTTTIFPTSLVPSCHGSTTPPCYDGTNPITQGADGNVWFQDRGGIGRISNYGTREFALPGYLTDIAVTQTNLWLSQFGAVQYTPGVSILGYSGNLTYTYPWPDLGYDVYFTSAAPNALWSNAFDSNVGAIYFMRMSNAGQWVAYPVPGPRGTRPLMSASMVAPDGTVWIGYGMIYSGGAMYSLRTNRLMSTSPVGLTLASGQSALVLVQETNYAGPRFSATVSQYCALSVMSGRFPGTFTVSVTGVLYSSCGVTFTDTDGVSVWLPVSSTGGNTLRGTPRRRPSIEHPQLPFFFGRQLGVSLQ